MRIPRYRSMPWSHDCVRTSIVSSPPVENNRHDKQQLYWYAHKYRGSHRCACPPDVYRISIRYLPPLIQKRPPPLTFDMTEGIRHRPPRPGYTDTRYRWDGGLGKRTSLASIGVSLGDYAYFPFILQTCVASSPIWREATLQMPGLAG